MGNMYYYVNMRDSYCISFSCVYLLYGVLRNIIGQRLSNTKQVRFMLYRTNTGSRFISMVACASFSLYAVIKAERKIKVHMNVSLMLCWGSSGML